MPADEEELQLALEGVGSPRASPRSAWPTTCWPARSCASAAGRVGRRRPEPTGDTVDVLPRRSRRGRADRARALRGRAGVEVDRRGRPAPPPASTTSGPPATAAAGRPPSLSHRRRSGGGARLAGVDQRVRREETCAPTNTTPSWRARAATLPRRCRLHHEPLPGLRHASARSAATQSAPTRASGWRSRCWPRPGAESSTWTACASRCNNCRVLPVERAPVQGQAHALLERRGHGREREPRLPARRGGFRDAPGLHGEGVFDVDDAASCGLPETCASPSIAVRGDCGHLLASNRATRGRGQRGQSLLTDSTRSHGSRGRHFDRRRGTWTTSSSASGWPTRAAQAAASAARVPRGHHARGGQAGAHRLHAVHRVRHVRRKSTARASSTTRWASTPRPGKGRRPWQPTPMPLHRQRREQVVTADKRSCATCATTSGSQPPSRRLLRGACGATVLVDDRATGVRPHHAWAAGRNIVTVEGLPEDVRGPLCTPLAPWAPCSAVLLPVFSWQARR